MLLRQFQFGGRVQAIVFVGIFLHLWVFAHTRYDQLSYDVKGHLAHIELIARTRELPQANACWECHQMPLYYLAAASVYQVFSALPAMSLPQVMQGFSFFIYLLFTLVGLLLLRQFIKNTFCLSVAVLLFVFWPASFIHSVRVGNDSLFYLFFAINLYFLVRWQKEGVPKLLTISSIFGGLALLTKITGVLPEFLVFFGVAIAVCNHSAKFEFLKKYAIAGLIFLTSGLLTYFILILKGVRSVTKAEMLDGWLRVDNHLKNYLGFDLRTFLLQPWTATRGEAGGRQFFWNFYWKSSLFGEFGIPGFFAELAGRILSGCLLILLLYVLAANVRAFRTKDPSLRLLQILLLGSMTLTMGFRISYPYSCNADFRYFYPAIFALIILYVRELDYWGKKKTKFLFYVGFFNLLIFSSFGAGVFL